MNVHEVKTQIKHGNHAAAQATAVMAQARDVAGRCHARATALTRDSRHDQVHSGVRKVSEAAKEAGRVIDKLGSGIDAATTYLQVIG